jgi:hypothetical protein
LPTSGNQFCPAVLISLSPQMIRIGVRLSVSLSLRPPGSAPNSWAARRYASISSSLDGIFATTAGLA